MTEFFTRVEEQRKRLAEEKANKTIAIFTTKKVLEKSTDISSIKVVEKN